jgi:hypothetical protein
MEKPKRVTFVVVFVSEERTRRRAKGRGRAGLSGKLESCQNTAQTGMAARQGRRGRGSTRLGLACAGREMSFAGEEGERGLPVTAALTVGLRLSCHETCAEICALVHEALI